MAGITKNSMPIFVQATYANLIKGLVDEKLTKGLPVYAYLTDKEMFCYVSPKGDVHIIKGLNWQIQNVDELPEEGNKEILYIMDGTIYTYNGEQFVPSYQKISDKFDELKQKIDDIYNKEEINDKLGNIVSEEGNPVTVETFVKESIDDSLKKALVIQKV